ncbi:MAG: NADPH:quinone reductase [Betaproteobacteria bacterium]|nr:NADPH:quinone reductase [Betaproteobacteria bacterium]
MKAAWYERNGPAAEVMVVGEMPTPQPAVGEVRVRLHASGVNPSDVKSRMARPLGGPRIVPNSDGAGVIDAVGEGVSASRVGERVWTWNAQWQRPFGTSAEYVVLPQSQAVRMPDSLSFHAAACMGIPGLTALQAVRLAGDMRGKQFLVTGASSAVGHYITQMLSQAGAHVIGTVGNPAKAAHAHAAGAAHCIEYKTEDVVGLVKELTGGQGVDAVIDMDFSTTAGWLSHGLLKAHGQVVCYGSNPPLDISIGFRPLLFSSIGLKFFLVYDLQPADRQACLAQLSDMLANQLLAHTIGAVFTLDQVVQAHQTVEAGQTIGQVVLDIAQ